MVSFFLMCATTWLSLFSVWFLIGATHWGQQWTPALTLPHVRYGLSMLRMAENLIEASVRFVWSKAGLSTVLLGCSSLEHLEQALTYAERGGLSQEALRRFTRTLA